MKYNHSLARYEARLRVHGPLRLGLRKHSTTVLLDTSAIGPPDFLLEEPAHGSSDQLCSLCHIFQQIVYRTDLRKAHASLADLRFENLFTRRNFLSVADVMYHSNFLKHSVLF